jgi:hypothetical protein
MFDKLPFLQKFLSFLTRNTNALLLLMLALSLGANVYLVKWVKELVTQKELDDKETIKYERGTKDQLIDITKEQLKKEVYQK